MTKRKMAMKSGKAGRGLAAGIPSSLLKTCIEFNHLKHLFRQGWLRAGITRARCETVAEHTLGVSLLALFLADAHFPKINRAKLLRMALLHDFGEIYAGDIIPADGVSLERKHALEKNSVRTVLGRLPRGREYLALWQEFEDGRTAEARLLRELDRLEMALQACVYEREGLADLSRFFASADKAVASPALRKQLTAILRARPQREIKEKNRRQQS
ncbi:MAG TPA: HD domain-containing protein [Kiritimatiellia bacterium]|nr:HD domain-containing protein [Kiritimatiellia bacterium]HSA17196.1 HD domain-containing protein [Kiritimatiellia bacterium]